MIKEVILQDFFSFKGTNSVRLHPGANVLMGINGSGKTSFINAFRLLFEGIAGIGVERLLQGCWGGLGQVSNCTSDLSREKKGVVVEYVFDCQKLVSAAINSPFPDDVHYRIEFSPVGDTDYFLTEQLYCKQKEKNEPFYYLNFKNGKGRLSTRNIQSGKIDYTSYDGEDISSHELVLRQITDPQRYLPSNTIRKAIEQACIYDYFDTALTGKLRQPCEYCPDLRLRSNGSNIAWLLNNLKINATGVYDQIESQLSSVNGAYQSIVFAPFGERLYLTLKERNLGRTMSALHISEGTLRFLLLMSIFYNPKRGLLVGIDEPENGLHPDMIKSLCDMIHTASRQTQCVIATHSPLLLNHFDIEDVLVFEKKEDNSTIVKQYTENDFQDYGNDLLPGQLWLAGLIGGKRW